MLPVRKSINNTAPAWPPAFETAHAFQLEVLAEAAWIAVAPLKYGVGERLEHGRALTLDLKVS